MIGFGDRILGGTTLRGTVCSRGPSLEAPSSSCNLRTNKRVAGNLHSDLTFSVGPQVQTLLWWPVCVNPEQHTECFRLVDTFYDQYWAMCHCLLSARLLNLKGCFQKTAASWLGGLMSST